MSSVVKAIEEVGYKACGKGKKGMHGGQVR